jgi:acyl carrier protein
MKPTRDSVRTDILQMLRNLTDEWEFDGEVNDGTTLLGDLQFESLDVVVLSSTVQEHYGRVLPFHEFFVEIGQREQRDVTVGEWVDFVHRHLDGAAPRAQTAAP